MNAQAVEALIEKLNALSPEQRAEVEDFVDFLSVRVKKRAALDRLLAIAPAAEAAGIPPMSMEEINAEVKDVRAERRARASRARIGQGLRWAVSGHVRLVLDTNTVTVSAAVAGHPILAAGDDPQAASAPAAL